MDRCRSDEYAIPAERTNPTSREIANPMAISSTVTTVCSQSKSMLTTNSRMIEDGGGNCQAGIDIVHTHTSHKTTNPKMIRPGITHSAKVAILYLLKKSIITPTFNRYRTTSRTIHLASSRRTQAYSTYGFP